MGRVDELPLLLLLLLRGWRVFIRYEAVVRDELACGE